MLVLNLLANMTRLLLQSLLDPCRDRLLQLLQLAHVCGLGVFEFLEELTSLVLLGFDRILHAFCLVLHLRLVGAFLDVGVVAFLVLPRVFVHLLQPVTLEERVWSWVRSLVPHDIINFSEGPLGVFDRSDDFAVLISCAAIAGRHSLPI